MSSYVKRKERESFEAMMRRFNRMVLMSKSMSEARERRFFTKPVSKTSRRQSALRKEQIKIKKQKELY
ncbi:MAG: 30S ribosomal protein S21 [Patescibacteria group bacterium]